MIHCNANCITVIKNDARFIQMKWKQPSHPLNLTGCMYMMDNLTLVHCKSPSFISFSQFLWVKIYVPACEQQLAVTLISGLHSALLPAVCPPTAASHSSQLWGTLDLLWEVTTSSSPSSATPPAPPHPLLWFIPAPSLLPETQDSAHTPQFELPFWQLWRQRNCWHGFSFRLRSDSFSVLCVCHWWKFRP